MPANGLCLLADLTTDVATSPAFIAGVVGIVLLLAGGFATILWLRSWRERMANPEHTSPDETRARYRAMYEQGELSQEEYDRILQGLDERDAPPPGQ